MKVIGLTVLHYGADFLGYAIRSIIDYIDEYYVLYTPVGSHGHRTDIRCPDSREILMQIAHEAAGDKLHWYEGTWTNEGAHREAIHALAPDADAIVVLDSDEIWPEHLIVQTVKKAIVGDNVRRLRLPIIHYWRSFYRAVLHDPAFPVRVLYPKSPDVETTFTAHWAENGKPIVLNHMGYAQRSEIVRYKLLTHGHRNEFRRDCDWLQDRFMANAQHDCHPVGSEYWNPEPVDPLDYMPEWMQEHPYYKLDVIP